jgi:hypothetical protein
MKKIIFALVCFASISAHAQTADEIVSKYAAAIGGLDNFSKVKTLKLSGTMSAQGNDANITLQIINTKAVRVDIDVMGQSITNAYKDGKGWQINPLMGMTTASDMPDAQLPDMKTQTYVANQLINYKTRGFKIELLGDETVDGVKTKKIKLTPDTGSPTTYFIDANTYLIVKSVITRKDPSGEDVEIETYYTDLKDVNGLKFFMTRTQKVGGEVVQEFHFDKVELDTPMDEKIFDKP